MRVVRVAVVAALTLGAASAARAQDPAVGWRGESFVGSMRLALDAAYEPSLPDARPRASWLAVSVAAAPIVNEHWQVGVNPSWTRYSQAGTFHQGSFAIFANYLLLTGDVSRPYVGGFVSETGTTHERSYGAWGAQIGWLHFLSAPIALRVEARLRHYLATPHATTEDIFVTFDPYIFGRADVPVNKLPELGVFDATVFGDLQVLPAHIGQLNATVAPFLTRWLQLGGAENFIFYFDQNEGSHYLELYGRGYLPVSTRAAPFAGLFTSVSQRTREAAADHTHGERIGVRTYLAPGVALDLFWQWRDHRALQAGSVLYQPFEERTLGVSLTTQFRAARPR